MGSTLSVSELQGLTSGNDANVVKVPSGHTLHAPGHQLQTVYTSSDTTTTVNSTSFTEPSTNYRVSITPKFANSLIMIDYVIPTNPGANYAANTIYTCRAFRLKSGGSKDYTSFENAGKANGSRNRIAGMAIRPVGYDTNDPMWWQMRMIDKPNTTGSVSYGFEFKRETGGTGTVYFGYSSGDNSNWGYSSDILITATEIAQ